ncbi:hypothetical protein ABE007_06425 [Bacillus altitudinis]|uniref:hypothetical protein n=1 Tax=Bacillus altitudinis TaxID=293387 RepID=UPI0003069D04|nr:hypothetical protein [Bacillus altitudinis]
MGHSEADHIARQLKAEKGFFLYKSQSTLMRVCFFLWQKNHPKAAQYLLKTFGLL